MSLKRKFLLYVLLPIIFLVAASLLMLQSEFSKTNKEIKKEKVLSYTENFSTYILNKFSADINALQTFADYWSRYDKDAFTTTKETELLLRSFLLRHHDYKAIWFIRKDATKVPQLFKVSKLANKTKTEIRELSDNDILYKDILFNIQTKSNDIFIRNYNPLAKTVNIAIPLENNFIALGLLNIEINLDELIDNFQNHYTEEGFTFFILNEDDAVLSNAETADFKDAFMNEYEKNVIGSTLHDKLYISFYSDEGILCHAGIKEIELKANKLNWKAGVLANENTKNTLPAFLKTRTFLILFLIIFVSLGIFWFYTNTLIKKIRSASNKVNDLLNGNYETLNVPDEKKQDDISNIELSVHKLKENLNNTASYIKQINEGNINLDYTPAQEDIIGKRTLELAKNLKQAQEERYKRRKEDDIQNWRTSGSALFAEIIRDYSDNLQELSYAIISKLVNYIDADQGGIFIIYEDAGEKYIDLVAGYAYDRRKMLEKRIPFGTGLVGRCILERESIFMTKIPDNYLNITSGLGKEKPKNLLIVPLIFHDIVYGVAELASLKPIEDYKIKFIEEISQSIASAISMVKINT